MDCLGEKYIQFSWNDFSGIGSCFTNFGNKQFEIFFSGILGNILGDEFPLNAYSKENLEAFHKRLVCYLCDEEIEVEQLEKSLYSYEKIIRNKITSVYYEYHIVKYFFTPDEKNGVFDVRAEIIYKVVNKYKQTNLMNFRIKTFCLNGKDGSEDYKNNFVLEQFTINIIMLNTRRMIKW